MAEGLHIVMAAPVDKDVYEECKRFAFATLSVGDRMSIHFANGGRLEFERGTDDE